MIKYIIRFFKNFKYKYVGQLTQGIRHDYINSDGENRYYISDITYTLLVNGFGKRKYIASLEYSYDKVNILRTDTYRRAVLPWLNGAGIHPTWYEAAKNALDEKYRQNNENGDKPEETKEATILKHPHLTLVDGEKDKKNDDDTDDFIH